MIFRSTSVRGRNRCIVERRCHVNGEVSTSLGLSGRLSDVFSIARFGDWFGSYRGGRHGVTFSLFCVPVTGAMGCGHADPRHSGCPHPGPV